MFKETAKVSELKSSIHALVDESKNFAVLKKVEKELKTEKEDWWDELPVEQQTRITNALKNAKARKNLGTHKKVKKNVKVRSSKLQAEKNNFLFDDLTAQQNKELLKSLKEADEAKSIISHEEFKKSLNKTKKKWLAKL